MYITQLLKLSFLEHSKVIGWEFIRCLFIWCTCLSNLSVVNAFYNILNLSMSLGLDISAEAEKERGRIRSFEEQEIDAFQRVKRELFRDVPYLLIIDNLENDRDLW